MSDVFVAESVSLHERGKWMSFLSTIWGFGISLGPIIGGILAHNHAWRWIFLMNAPACLPATAVILLALRSNPRSTARPYTARLPLRDVDYLGIVLLCSSTSAILIPCVQAQTVSSWTDWQVYVPIICGLLLGVAFFVYEVYLVRHPLIPLHVFNNRASILALSCAMLHSLTLWSILFFLPFYFETVLDFSSARAGLAMLTPSLSSAFISAITGVVISRICHYRWAIWAGWILTTAGYGLLCLLDTTDTPGSWIPVTLAAGTGAGLLFISMNLATQAPVAQKYVATALTMHTFVRALGSVGDSFKSRANQAQCLFLSLLTCSPGLWARRELCYFPGPPQARATTERGPQ
jgi:MFS family permease